MPSYQFPVEAAQIALFVRAAGGTDVDIFDPELAGPPTFTQSGAQFDPEWPFRPRPGRPWQGSGRARRFSRVYLTARVGQQIGERS
jgi:hypothetical protein